MTFSKLRIVSYIPSQLGREGEELDDGHWSTMENDFFGGATGHRK